MQTVYKVGSNIQISTSMGKCALGGRCAHVQLDTDR